jgi:hypothetical protein
MRNLLLAATMALGLAGTAHAVPVIQLAQTSNSNTITATANAGNTITTLSGSNIQINVTQDLGGITGLAFLQFHATSINAASSIGPITTQNFAGHFEVTTLSGGLGTNILSGVFSDAAFGNNGAFTVQIASPPDTLTLTSDVISQAQLQPPIALAFSMTNATPGIHIQGTTIAPFTATISGNASANAADVPEPATLALLGVGMIGIAAVRRKRAA